MKMITTKLNFFLAIAIITFPFLLPASNLDGTVRQTSSSFSAPLTRSLRLSVSPGATVYRATDGFQTSFSVMEQYGNFLIGLESAYMRWTPSARTDYTGMKVGQTTIPLLATAIFRFTNDSGVYPYLGGSLGIGISKRDNESSTHFESIAYCRPGVEFEIASALSFTIEPRIGLLDDSFIFAPMVGLSISL